MKKFKHIYGPVSSWRLGRSLGIDLLSQKDKICSFDCVYCQIAKNSVYCKKRKIYVPTDELIQEIKQLPNIKFDYITLSGTGEVTMAKNMAQAIVEIKKIRKEPVAVITNSYLMTDKTIRKELMLADCVVAKLDACDDDVFKKINNPLGGFKLADITEGLKKFTKDYKGRFDIQIMFVKQNENMAVKFAKIAKYINPDFVEINTPLRPCKVKPLSKAKIKKIASHFKGLNVINVYDSPRKTVKALSQNATIRRRGCESKT